MARTDCPPESALIDLHVGANPDGEADSVADHLDGCRACENRYRDIERGHRDRLLSALRRADGILAPPADGTRETAVIGAIGRIGSSGETVADAAIAGGHPERVGRYRVTGSLGRGGMGVVYRAEDPDLRRPVALKVLNPRYAADPEARARFVREGWAAAGVRSDHIVSVFDAGDDGGTPYLAMELLEGESVDDWMRRTGTVPESEVLRIGREAAIGLLVAHARGLIHRDIKPSNLWLQAPNRRVKLLDFGLALRGSGEDDLRLTRDGYVIGTPGYLAPEQADGRPLDARTDLFSLGCVLYRLATGRAPYAGDTPLAVLNALATHTPAPARKVNPAVSPALSRLVGRLMARDPQDRPDSAAAVIVAIRAIEAGGTADRRRHRWLAPAAAVAAAALGAWAAWPNPRAELTPAGERSAPDPPPVRPIPVDSDGRVGSVGRLHPDEQLKAVVSELRRLNPGYEPDGRIHAAVERDTVVGLSIPSEGLTDLSPLRALTGLTGLQINPYDRPQRRTELTDLSPLRGLQLQRIAFNYTGVSDLTPLAGMPLVAVYAEATPIADLNALRGMLLWELGCGYTGVSSLEPLRGMPLHKLFVHGTRVSDLDPIRGADKLHTLNCSYTDVADLSPLRGKPLRFLSFERTPAADLSPLAGCPLELVTGPIDRVRDRPILEPMRTLREINGAPPELFWPSDGK